MDCAGPVYPLSRERRHGGQRARRETRANLENAQSAHKGKLDSPSLRAGREELSVGSSGERRMRPRIWLARVFGHACAHKAGKKCVTRFATSK
ncbi:hypothetical protein MRX96_004902 [Rhipicephalus microplus]